MRADCVSFRRSLQTPDGTHAFTQMRHHFLEFSPVSTFTYRVSRVPSTIQNVFNLIYLYPSACTMTCTLYAALSRKTPLQLCFLLKNAAQCLCLGVKVLGGSRPMFSLSWACACVRTSCETSAHKTTWSAHKCFFRKC